MHSDDGRRYVNDADGGLDFTEPIRPGETVGLGITYSMPDAPASFAQASIETNPLKGEVFFTRNGKKSGTWNIQEEFDATNEFGNVGIDGRHDLYGAIGTFGEVSFEAFFKPRDWLWRPN